VVAKLISLVQLDNAKAVLDAAASVAQLKAVQKML